MLVVCTEPGGSKNKCLQTGVGLDEESEQKLPEGLGGRGVRQKEADSLLPVILSMCHWNGNNGDGAGTQKEKALQIRAYDESLDLSPETWGRDAILNES